MATQQEQKRPVQVAYIGCWYRNDMYSHNCSNLVESLRRTGTRVDVITSNCRCFSSAQRFAITKEELINLQCSPVAIPHAPRDPGRKHGKLKQLLVKFLRLDFWLAATRGFLYYSRSRHADVIHFDQVLEAFGCLPLFILVTLAGRSRKNVVVTVHEIDPFQLKHTRFNRLYGKCAEVLVYSENMKQQLIAIGVPPENLRVIRYGARIPDLVPAERTQYLYFGGHNIGRGKGYVELLDALALLKARGTRIAMVIYVGYGCNGLEQAKQLAVAKRVDDMLRWEDFYSADELATVYQRSKACIIPFTGGSARHPLTSAMVNATPVIATRAVDIPEYLGNLGIYVDGSADSIAHAVSEIESGEHELSALGASLRKKALEELDYDRIACGLSHEYGRIAKSQELLKIAPVQVA